MGADPIVLGLVENINHPGGNITGATSLNTEVNPKRLKVGLSRKVVAPAVEVQ
jgi:hypothetical protein